MANFVQIYRDRSNTDMIDDPQKEMVTNKKTLSGWSYILKCKTLFNLSPKMTFSVIQMPPPKISGNTNIIGLSLNPYRAIGSHDGVSKIRDCAICLGQIIHQALR